MFKTNITFKNLCLLMLAAVIVLSCKKDDPEPFTPPDHDRAEVNEITSLGIYTPDEIWQIFEDEDFEVDVYLDLSVEAFSVKYYSVDGNGNDIIVSGAMLVPLERSPLGMMSIQHGTVLQRDRVASIQPEKLPEGIVGLLTASMGYVTIIPDYPGYGESRQTHTYMHAESIVPSVIDLILVAQEYCDEQEILMHNGLFMTGYSEGAYITLQTQREIEKSYADEIELVGVAPLAGLYDLEATYEKIFCDMSYGRPAYLAFWLTSYNDFYGWNKLDEFFQAPYAGMMTGLFDGTKSWDHVENILPDDITELMHPDFCEKFVADQSSIVWEAVRENTVLDWTPQAALHFFHGDCDNVAYCLNAQNAYEAFIANGCCNVELTILEGKDHESAGEPAIKGAIEWIEDFHPDL